MSYDQMVTYIFYMAFVNLVLSVIILCVLAYNRLQHNDEPTINDRIGPW